jgi:hypothetical protein
MRKIDPKSGWFKGLNTNVFSLSSLRTQWYAVSIIPGKPRCRAVEEYVGRRLLSAEAPRFPVAGCDVKNCDCRYRHHSDRRAKLRRQSDGGNGIPRPWSFKDRRTGIRGRRESDVSESGPDTN